MARFDNTELIAGIRRKARIPDESTDYTDNAILEEADQVLLNRITQEILGTFTEHYVRFFDFPIVAGQQAINIPGNNVGGVVRDVVYFRDNVTVTGWSLPQYDLSDLDTTYGIQPGRPSGHIFRDDQILLVPTPNVSSGIIRVHIEYRPGKLVIPAEAAQITSRNFVTGEMSCNAPSIWSTGDRFDIKKVTSPFSSVAFGLTATAVTTSTSVTFDPDDLDSVRIGADDYVTLEGESPIAQCHATFHTALQWGVASSILQSIGDPHGANAQGKFENALIEARHVITPRNKGEAQYIINRNSHIRSNRSNWYNGRGLF